MKAYKKIKQQKIEVSELNKKVKSNMSDDDFKELEKLAAELLQKEIQQNDN